MPINPNTDPHDYSPADLLHDNLKDWNASSAGGRGPAVGGGTQGSVFSFLAVGTASLGAIVGLIVGREDRWLTTVIFALLFGLPVWLFGVALKLVGRGVRAGIGGMSALRDVPRWTIQGGVFGALAGAVIAWFVGGVSLMEGVTRLAPVGAGIGFLLRLGYVLIRRGSISTRSGNS